MAAAVAPSAMLTDDQQRREHALILATLLDGGMIVLLFSGGLLGGSLTCLAEGVRGLLMTLIDLVSLYVIRRLHRGSLRGFDYGTGKIEQLCSAGIAAGLAGAACWVAWDALAMVSRGESDASPLGLSLAAVVAALNLLVNYFAWDSVRLATLGRPSVIMEAQLHARTTKLVASLTVQVTMTVAAVAKDPVIVAIADAVGAFLVCTVMVRASWQLLKQAIPDLLDRSINHVVEATLHRAAAGLPPSFVLRDFRSRGGLQAFVLEVSLACPPGTGVAAVEQAEALLAADIARALPGVEPTVVVRAVSSDLP
ncbi:MAG TPA: cation transporter [Reyranella sp.]|nr:cation transporter [Reyranella sp.]